MRKLLLFSALLLLSGCDGVANLIVPGPEEAPATDTPTDDTTPKGPTTGPLTDDDVYTRLSPTCVACHGTAANKPYFASLQSFQTLFVADRKWIIPGKPETSALLPLLRAEGQGSYAQMPVGGDSFAVKQSKGETLITLDELAQWILNMPVDPNPTVAAPDPKAPLVQRKSTANMLRALKTQLGLTDAELGASAFNATDPDSTTGKSGYNDEFWVRYQQLGGAYWLQSKKPLATMNRSFAQQWVPMSQAMCKLAVAKSNNAAFFIDATPSDRSTTTAGAAAIQKNITTLYLKMLGQEPGSADVQALYALYVAKEATSAQDAWANVCAALLRDPLWLTY